MNNHLVPHSKRTWDQSWKYPFYFFARCHFLDEQVNVWDIRCNEDCFLQAPSSVSGTANRKNHEENAFFRSQSPKVRVIRRHGQQRGLSEDVSTSLMQRPANWARPSHYPLSGDLNWRKISKMRRVRDTPWARHGPPFHSSSSGRRCSPQSRLISHMPSMLKRWNHTDALRAPWWCSAGWPSPRAAGACPAEEGVKQGERLPIMKCQAWGIWLYTVSKLDKYLPREAPGTQFLALLHEL